MKFTNITQLGFSSILVATLLFININLDFSLTSKFVFAASSSPSAKTKLENKVKQSEATIKTLPDNPIQKLVVPNESPFAKLYQEALKNPSINPNAVQKAFEFLIQNKDELKKEGLCLNKDNTANTKKIRNLNCLVVADYSKSKMEQRLHVFKFDENKIYSLYTAHGKGSNEIEKAKMATKFSNISGSLQTSLGFYLTDHPYSSSKNTFGPGPNNGIKLDGLQCSNNNAKKRFIVMHTAKYVPDKITDESSIDYSEGCITFAPSQQKLMLSCANGALLYNHAE